LSKGHLEENEEPIEGAKREVGEELGVSNLIAGENLGTNEYVASDPKVGKVRRQVTYFLFKANTKELKDLTTGEHSGLDDAKWFSSEEIAQLKTYDDIKPLLNKALDIIKQKPKA